MEDALVHVHATGQEIGENGDHVGDVVDRYGGAEEGVEGG